MNLIHLFTVPLGQTADDAAIAYRLRGPIQQRMVAGDVRDSARMLGREEFRYMIRRAHARAWVVPAERVRAETTASEQRTRIMQAAHDPLSWMFAPDGTLTHKGA